MKRTCLFGKYLAAVVCMLFVALNAQAQETIFVFEGTATGDFATAHSETDFSAYEQTTLKVSGPLNGDDINAIKRAISQRFTTLDIGGAKITSEGQYTGSGERNMKEDAIATYMFVNVTNMQYIVLPEGIKSVGYGAFYGCIGLKSIVLPDAISIDGDNVFKGCTALESVTLPKNITTLPSYFFDGCTSLPYVKIPDGVTALPAYMFNDCSALQTVDMPDGITSFGNFCFSGCTSLKNFDLPSSLTTIGSYAFQNCTMLTTVSIPSSVSSLSNNTFQNCTALQSVELPDALASIGNYCFYKCASLAEIELPSGLTTLGTYTFGNCPLLTQMAIPVGIKSIPSYLFYGCTGLEGVSCAPDITSIGSSAFQECSSLKQFSIPQTVTTIGTSAFRGCIKITSIAIPEGITSVPNYFCYGCTSLADVTLPSTITNIGLQSFYNCASLREIKLPEGVTTIGGNAFAYTALDKVSMPSTVRTINGQAFANCDNLSTFTVNEGVTAISDYSSIWEGCDNLSVLYLPSTITSLHYNTISNTNIKEVHLKATVPPTVGSYNVGKSGATLYVPFGTLEAYKAASHWSGWDAIYEESYTLAGIPEKEWNILKHIPALTGGENWKTKWVFGATPEETELPEGVTIRNGHIYSIVLGNNNLTGPLPHVAFALDSLNNLYLADNNLSGNIRMNYEDDTFDYANLSLCCDSLKRLDISGNNLTGDLYDIMAYAPNLKTLKASYNKIRDISNPLPIPTLECYGQDLRDMYTVNYSDFFKLKGSPQSVVPTVFTYNNKSNSTESENIDTYDNVFNLVISDAWNANSRDHWYGSMTKRLDNGSGALAYYSYDAWCDGWYTKPSGETLNAGVKVGTSRWTDYHRFNVVMDFCSGDVNFDTELDITDMQRTLNYALDSTYYSRYTPFNFTAANIIATDQTINVQDVVANINLLLESGVTPQMARRMRGAEVAADEAVEDPEAVMYVKEGKLILSATRPVAALDLLLTGENVKWSPAVDVFSKKSKGNRTIIYSLFGDEIMEGETVIAEVDGNIDDAMIVDLDGNALRLNVLRGNDSGTTAIEGAAAADDSNTAVLDLQGRKVAERFDRNTLKPGIYIVNGKKVVIK